MALSLSEEQLAVLAAELKRTNQQMQMLLEKWNQAQAERFGRSSEKMNYDSQTYQQLELAVMYAQCFNEAEATIQGKPLEEPVIDEVTICQCPSYPPSGTGVPKGRRPAFPPGDVRLGDPQQRNLFFPGL